jgi:FliI/YscN family ATPase
MDGGPTPVLERLHPLQARPPRPLDRERILEPLATGVRAIDALLTCGKGQRVGLFAGSGVGKSTLLGMCARGTAADVTVIALVGERGREVREFIEKDLGPEGLKRSVVVVETSERPALLRVRAPFTATAVAEYFRDEGLDVLLLLDSLTRLANAQREVGLSAGEPPATKGYLAVGLRADAAPPRARGPGRARVDHRLLHRSSSRATMRTSRSPTPRGPSSTAMCGCRGTSRIAVTIPPSIRSRAFSRS